MTLDCSPNDPCADREGSLHASSARSSSLACKCSPRRHFPTGARAACELFALLDPSAAPPKGIVNALVAAARSTREDEDEGGQGDQGGKGGKGGWTDGGNAMRDAHVAPPCKQVLTTARFPHRCLVCRASEPMLSPPPYRVGRRHVAGSSGLRGVGEHCASQERHVFTAALHVFTAGAASELAVGGGMPRCAATNASGRADRFSL
jgi:hypothetical protein